MISYIHYMQFSVCIDSYDIRWQGPQTKICKYILVYSPEKPRDQFLSSSLSSWPWLPKIYGQPPVPPAPFFSFSLYPSCYPFLSFPLSIPSTLSPPIPHFHFIFRFLLQYIPFYWNCNFPFHLSLSPQLCLLQTILSSLKLSFLLFIQKSLKPTASLTLVSRFVERMFLWSLRFLCDCFFQK